MCVIGLTGGIACGKSTVAKELQNLPHFSIIDCDKIGHDILNENEVVKKFIFQEFGRENVTSDDGSG